LSLQNFVYKNPSNAHGMPDFTGKLSAQDVEKIKAFIAGTADAGQASIASYKIGGEQLFFPNAVK
jgi:ABC-type tungstate transport system permease subunit